MREGRNIVFIAQSLDGYIAGPGGEIDWLDMVANPTEDDMGYFDLMKEVDAIVMGRKSFDFVSNYEGPWPYTKKVFVLSHTLSAVPARLVERAEIISGSPEEILATLSEKGYNNLYIDGGVTIQSFLKEDLIDELRITTLPILLGKGFSLFGELDQRLTFEHKATEVYLGQLVQSHYLRKNIEIPKSA